MADGLLAYLGRDSREALAAGSARQPAVSPDGGGWLARWALIAAVVGATLYLFCGYHAGFERINGLAARTPPWIWEWLTVLGDERVAFGLSLLLSRRHPRVFWTLIMAALVAIAYTHSLKPLFSALRPPAVMSPDTFNLIGPGHRKGSFPSGHTATISVFIGVLVYHLRSRPLRAALIVLALAVGASRVAVGVHWPVDVAAGMAGGALAAWAGANLARRAEWGVYDPSAHLAFVALACVAAVTLLYWHGGYPGAARFQQLIGAGGLGYAAYAYLIHPVWRWRRDPRRFPGGGK